MARQGFDRRGVAVAAILLGVALRSGRVLRQAQDERREGTFQP
jgi:hypothetical protein